MESVEREKHLEENIYLRKIAEKAIDDLTTGLMTLRSPSPYLSLPADQYPHYLIHLLKNSQATVKAIALVDKEEHFWRSRIGDKLFQNTNENSTRVFVFASRDHFRENILTLRKHRRKYNVRILSHDNLAWTCPEYLHDFSIIGDIAARLLARYDDSGISKVITFSTDKDEISKYEDKLDQIIRSAVEFPKDFQEDMSEVLEAEAFRPLHKKGGRISEKKIEMSEYIEIDEYDQHEEKHAYYVEMMEEMASISANHRNSFAGKIKVLELGAGTGIFTQRLIELKEFDITAIDIDWVCYRKLTRKKAKFFNAICRESGSVLQCLNEDSRTFSPGFRCHYIFSAFADHHIKPYDKEDYLANIKRNLHENGLFIVGDEFLPAYDIYNVESRRNALKKYHGHIIEMAETQASQEEKMAHKLRQLGNQKQAEEHEAQAEGYRALAKLEGDALESGLNETGDFKLSCQEYEAIISKAGFKFQKRKIGPLNQDDLGGIYVYQMEL
jgi:SAM-dependent methyltransferase